MDMLTPAEAELSADLLEMMVESFGDAFCVWLGDQVTEHDVETVPPELRHALADALSKYGKRVSREFGEWFASTVRASKRRRLRIARRRRRRP
jgi:hypothetical protein